LSITFRKLSQIIPRHFRRPDDFRIRLRFAQKQRAGKRRIRNKNKLRGF